MQYSSPDSRRRGFTLVEILVVVLIIGLLISVVAPNVFGGLLRGQRGAAKMQIHAFKTACMAYQGDHHRYPDRLEELAGDDLNGQPYLDGGKVPLDPWGNEFEYSVEPDGSILIVSLGTDGVPSEDDVRSDE